MFKTPLELKERNIIQTFFDKYLLCDVLNVTFNVSALLLFCIIRGNVSKSY